MNLDLMWNNFLQKIKEHVSALSYETWFQDTKLVAIKDTVSDISSLTLDDFYFSYGPGLRFLIPQFPLHLLFAWRFRVVDGVPTFAETGNGPFQFVLSFNITNR